MLVKTSSLGTRLFEMPITGAVINITGVLIKAHLTDYIDKSVFLTRFDHFSGIQWKAKITLNELD